MKVQSRVNLPTLVIQLVIFQFMILFMILMISGLSPFMQAHAAPAAGLVIKTDADAKAALQAILQRREARQSLAKAGATDQSSDTARLSGNVQSDKVQAGKPLPQTPLPGEIVGDEQISSNSQEDLKPGSQESISRLPRFLQFLSPAKAGSKVYVQLKSVSHKEGKGKNSLLRKDSSSSDVGSAE